MFLGFMSSLGQLLANDDIPLSLELPEATGENRNEGLSHFPAVFHATLHIGEYIKVSSSQSTTFSVSVIEKNSLATRYNGSTVNGMVHFTNALPEGVYILKITNHGIVYWGEFCIAQNN